MAWAFYGVLNAGVQILVCMLSGWCCARLRLVDQELLSRQLNYFAMLIAVPAFIIQFLGIKTDLTDPMAWRSLGIYVLWGAALQLGCLTWAFMRKAPNLKDLGRTSLLLTNNNTGLIGWPLLTSTLGQGPASIALLMGMLVNLQFMPFAVTCFEWQEQSLPVTRSPAQTSPPAASSQASSRESPQPVHNSPCSEKRQLFCKSSPPAQRLLDTPLSKPPSADLSNKLPPLAQRGFPALLASPSGRKAPPVLLPIASMGPWGPEMAEDHLLSPAAAGATVLHSDSVLYLHEGSPDHHLSVPALRPFGGSCHGSRSSSSSSSSSRTSSSNDNEDQSSCCVEQAVEHSEGKASCCCTRAARPVPGAAKMVPRGSNIPIVAAPAGVPCRDTANGDISDQQQRQVNEEAGSRCTPNWTSKAQGNPVLATPVATITTTSSSGSSSSYKSSCSSNSDLRRPSKSSTSSAGDGDQGAGAAADTAGDSLRPLPVSPARRRARDMLLCSTWLTGQVRTHPRLVHVLEVQLKNPFLWTNLMAVVISVTGLRQWLDPDSPKSIPALAWIEGSLRWGALTCVPLMLFASGVWAHGKPILTRKIAYRVILLLALKLLVLPWLMVALTVAFGMRDARGLALVLLTCCPVAQLSFVLSQQYNAGAELVTGVIIMGVLLMLPQSLLVLHLAEVTGMYDYQLQTSAVAIGR